MASLKNRTTYDDVNLLMKLYEMRREERMRKARAWFATNFRAKTLDEFWKLCPAGSEENASYRQVTSYWEMVASFVNRGVLNEELFFENCREMLLVWVRIEPLLPLAREAFKDPFAHHNLEAISRKFIDWMNARAPGSYEAFAGRVQ